MWSCINNVNLEIDTSKRVLHKYAPCTSRRHYRNMGRTLKSMLHCLCICGYVGVGVWNSKLLTNVWVTLSSGGAGSHKLLIPHLKNTLELRARSITTLELRGGGETGKEERALNRKARSVEIMIDWKAKRGRIFQTDFTFYLCELKWKLCPDNHRIIVMKNLFLMGEWELCWKIYFFSWGWNIAEL